MTRLDPKSGKSIVTVGPSTETIQQNLAETGSKEDLEQGPIKTAASYSSRVQARKAAGTRIKKRHVPLGGATPLDPEKMAKVSNSLMPRPSFEKEGPPDEPPTKKREPVDPPAPVSGVGAAYSINQRMAQGELERPVSLKEANKMEPEQPSKKPLSQETVDGLAAVQQAIETGEEETEPQASIAEDDTGERLEAASEEMVNRNPDLFNFGSISQAQRHMQSETRRKTIEEKLTSMDVSDLITKNEVSQEIPSVSGKITYVLRTINQGENLFCLEYQYDHPGSGLYNEEFLTTCKLVCSLIGMNGAKLPEHRKAVGTPQEEVDRDMFTKKLGMVARLPVQLIADLSIQSIWFNDRVNKLFDLENLKNG